MAIAGLKDEVVELLVKGARIQTIEELAAKDPAELYKAFEEIIRLERVRVPREFSFTIEDVAYWIEIAKR